MSLKTNLSIATELTCGKQDIQPIYGNGKQKIVNGVNVRRGSWPWMIDMALDVSGHYCGAVLIHPRYVLTAAQCLFA